MSDTVRKKASELQVGDEVVGYGVLTHVSTTGGPNVLVSRFNLPPTHGGDWWPSDAEVTVKVKPRKWQRTITQTTADENRARYWRNAVGVRYDDFEYGEVVEL